MAYYKLPTAAAHGLKHVRVGACMDMRHELHDIAAANQPTKLVRFAPAKWAPRSSMTRVVKAGTVKPFQRMR